MLRGNYLRLTILFLLDILAQILYLIIIIH